MGDEMSKSNRVLDLYQALQNGQVINKKAAAEAYGVNEKSIQRDLDSIRDFLSEQTTRQGLIQSVEFDRTANGYRLVTEEMIHISEGEMLAICKILLESRAFDKTELESLVNKVMNHCVSPKKVKSIEPFISNELFNYREPAHRPPNMSVLWQAAQAIQTQNMLEITYLRKDDTEVKRKIEPVGLLFSEYYFYVMAFIADKAKRETFEKPNDAYPTVYRLDRIQSAVVLDEKFDIPYKDRFKEGEYKNRNIFMYGGVLQTVEFTYSGPAIESVLDRLPTAEVKQNEDGSYTVKAETFGNLLDESAQHITSEFFEQSIAKKNANFSNGRFARNIYDDLVMNHARRVVHLEKPTRKDLCTIIAEDFHQDCESVEQFD